MEEASKPPGSESGFGQARWMDNAAARRALGLGVVLGTVTIWAAWILWTRASVAQDYGAPLSGIDVGLLRFGIPALLLAPAWIRVGLKPKQTSWGVLLAMLGWGAPFVLFASHGLKTTSVAHMAAFVPGMMPIWAALVMMLLFGERYRGGRLLGLGLILVAAALLILPLVAADQFDKLAGLPWLLAAGASWAAFAVSFRYSGLSAMEAAGVVAVYSTAILGVLALFYGSQLGTLSWGELGFHALTHGVLAGAASVVGYAYAISLLGPMRAASFSALVPVLASLMAWAVLGEVLSPREWIAVFCASLGVALVNNAFSRQA